MTKLNTTAPGQTEVYAKVTKNGVTAESERHTLNVLGVDGIKIYANGSWHDAPDTLVVLKGAKYTFKAVLKGGTTWPDGQPKWSGIESGTGETIEVTFNSAGDGKKLKASCGASSHEITIDVIAPQIDYVKFMNSYDIHDGDEVWLAGRAGQSARNNPGCFKQGTKTQLQIKFWHQKPLTYSVNVVVKGNVHFLDEGITKGDYAEGSGSFGTSWPSSGIHIQSEQPIPSKINSDTDVDIAWSYRVPSGTDVWIAAGDTDNLVYYVIWDSPSNGKPNSAAEAWGASHFTRGHIEDATSWAHAGASIYDIADKVCARVGRSTPTTDVPYYVANIWGIHDTANGECDEMALEMCYVMRCLGIPFNLAYASLLPALNTSGGSNGFGWCRDHKVYVKKVGDSFWTSNNFQGCAYYVESVPARDTVCWDPQHNEHRRFYWQLGNDKFDSYDAPGGRFGILYSYHWRSTPGGGTLQQVLNGDSHENCLIAISWEFRGN